MSAFRGMSRKNAQRFCDRSVLKNKDLKRGKRSKDRDTTRMNKEIMMMQQPVQAAPSKSIPQHVVERIESEWKQMRENAAPQPKPQR
ncbi:hypothetical protein ACFFP0_21115 [Rhizobium puerariae]|uniref:Uncharacterized protein n=1 Tax=Rhizobium puerariae TaxID=1585791 RepID=A0ABV6AL60_9HYPH